MTSKKKQAVVAIVGGGLVGTLNAIYFAQRGWKVDLFELRPDMRLPIHQESRKGKSINLALSERGISALRAPQLDLEKLILSAAVPMKARMVHLGKEGKQVSQAYDVNGQHINAVDRARLNELLLNAAETQPNVTIYFEHRLIQADLDKNVLQFENRMDYQQYYIDTGYCELSMPPARDTQGNPTFALDPNHLHIWPRHTFMLIALPNPDFSFTCTLFMPFGMFDEVNTEDRLMEFFREHFNDAIPLIGESHLISDYFNHPRGSLVTVKASPHHYEDKSVLVGDAAHAMVPFYGQGMNCGFQDVEVLHQVLDRHGIKPIVTGETIVGLQEALEDYSATRVKDAHAICDLALYNYEEMRHAVTSVRFLARKKLEGLIHATFPRLIIPLYTMVSFSTLPYSKAIERWHRQTYWLNVVIASTTVLTLGAVTSLGLKHRNQWMPPIKSFIDYVKQLK